MRTPVLLTPLYREKTEEGGYQVGSVRQRVVWGGQKLREQNTIFSKGNGTKQRLETKETGLKD